METAVRLTSVSKSYGSRSSVVSALDDVTVDFHKHAFTVVMGPSGSGKSTLLHCAAGLDRPTSGTVVIDRVDLTRLDDAALTKLRRVKIGFIFQSFNLLSSLTVEQNVALPLRLAGQRPDGAPISAALKAVGLAGLASRRPSELSGGQQQLVAIARALITHPAVVFADEPTGELDIGTSHRILAMLRRLVDAHGQTVVVVSHDPAVADYAHRAIFLADGKLAADLADPTPPGVAACMTRLAVSR